MVYVVNKGALFGDFTKGSLFFTLKYVVLLDTLLMNMVARPMEIIECIKLVV